MLVDKAVDVRLFIMGWQDFAFVKIVRTCNLLGLLKAFQMEGESRVGFGKRRRFLTPA